MSTWGSAHVVLQRIPEDFHLQPFMKMASYVRDTQKSVLIGVLRSKHIHGAPEDYVVLAPDPKMQLYSYVQGVERRLPGDFLYVLVR